MKDELCKTTEELIMTIVPRTPQLKSVWTQMHRTVLDLATQQLLGQL